MGNLRRSCRRPSYYLHIPSDKAPKDYQGDGEKTGDGGEKKCTRWKLLAVTAGSGSRREEIYAQAFTVVLSGSKDVEEKVVNNPDE